MEVPSQYIYIYLSICIYIWLVVSTPLKNLSQLGVLFPMEKIIMFQNQPYVYIYIQCEAPKIAKLVYKSNNYGLWYL